MVHFRYLKSNDSDIEDEWFMVKDSYRGEYTVDCIRFYTSSKNIYRVDWKDVPDAIRGSEVVSVIPDKFKSAFFRKLFDKDDYFWPVILLMCR